MTRVFIDGKEGTTGLRLFERFQNRPDITLLTLPEEVRKDPKARKELLHQADISFLCLPDAAAKESVVLAQGCHGKILDTSTAHRTAAGWAYGFPELSAGHRRQIETGSLVAVPGCHASGFIALAYPLVSAGAAGPDYPFSCHSLTGYSGGGKKMIAQYEASERDKLLDSPRQYGLGQQHKHLPEMQALCGLDAPPVFCPIVGDFYAGMQVTLPIFPALLQKKYGRKELHQLLEAHYAGQTLVKVLPLVPLDYAETCGGFLPAGAMAGKDGMELLVAGCDERPLLIAQYDNLGKGASGAAIQCMNILLGLKETCGLVL
ncbi:MAG: N-acetyl-gamma-glutamyl-phosphate reductase [Oscillospiraceae bacterium]|nr:N-acetyl-gamma-glutamyl-phosphate reductase [Oscillospiraceae bacterium]